MPSKNAHFFAVREGTLAEAHIVRTLAQGFFPACYWYETLVH